jgi:hypothetical protein
MAKDDIYGSKVRYEKFKINFANLTKKPNRSKQTKSLNKIRDILT